MHRMLIALALIAATPAFAQTSGSPTRKMLEEINVPNSDYTVVMSTTTLAANFTVDRHTHPGTEMSYILEGEGDLYINDKLAEHLAPGSTNKVPANTPHYVITGNKPVKILVVYVIPKGAPISSPAPKAP